MCSTSPSNGIWRDHSHTGWGKGKVLNSEVKRIFCTVPCPFLLVAYCGIKIGYCKPTNLFCVVIKMIISRDALYLVTLSVPH